jgi:hypothetical protein
MVTEVKIMPTKSEIHFLVNGKVVKVSKAFTQNHEIECATRLNKSEEIACLDYFGKPQDTLGIVGIKYTISILKSKV